MHALRLVCFRPDTLSCARWPQVCMPHRSPSCSRQTSRAHVQARPSEVGGKYPTAVFRHLSYNVGGVAARKRPSRLYLYRLARSSTRPRHPAPSSTSAAMTRLLRTVHTSARLCDSAANASSLPIPPQWLRRGVRDFTPKGRPVPIRPARTTRVTLPSGYPEPPAYPPPQSYWDELDLIDRKGKPKPHPLWAFFHVPPQMQTRPEGNIFPSNMGSIDLMEDEEEGIRSGEFTARLQASRGVRRSDPSGEKWRLQEQRTAAGSREDGLQGLRKAELLGTGKGTARRRQRGCRIPLKNAGRQPGRVTTVIGGVVKTRVVFENKPPRCATSFASERGQAAVPRLRSSFLRPGFFGVLTSSTVCSACSFSFKPL